MRSAVTLQLDTCLGYLDVCKLLNTASGTWQFHNSVVEAKDASPISAH